MLLAFFKMANVKPQVTCAI